MNLLEDPLLRVAPGSAVCLPGLLAALARDQPRDFPGLRPHQRPAWHMFLVQLAVMALRNAPGPLPEDDATWRAALLALSSGDDGAWALVGPPDRPAFLQPAEAPGLKWTEVPTPDALDMLITSKNHDLKAAVAVEAAPEDWVFALVSLQTMEGYGGRGNNGIARMNGGSSSRPLLGLAPDRNGSPGPSAWWRRDVTALAANPPGAVGTPGGPALVWTLPWTEGRQLDLAALDPLAIEVCRRVRLELRGGRIVARRATSAAARIDAKAFSGATGDPWCPVNVKEGKSLTLGPRRFDYRLLTELMWGGEGNRAWARAPLTEPQDHETGPMLLVAEAFARGNSRTDGFMSRVVPVPGIAGFRPGVGEIARAQIAEIARYDEAIRNGLACLAAGGTRSVMKKPHYELTRPARAAFQAAADALFFPALWPRAAAAPGDDAPRDAFLRTLHAAALAEFEAARDAMPCPSALRPRAEVMAGMEFRRTLRVKNPWAHVVLQKEPRDADPQ